MTHPFSEINTFYQLCSQFRIHGQRALLSVCHIKAHTSNDTYLVNDLQRKISTRINSQESDTKAMTLGTVTGWWVTKACTLTGLRDMTRYYETL